MLLNSIKRQIAVIGGLCLTITAISLVGLSLYAASETKTLVSTRASKQVQDETLRGLLNLANRHGNRISQTLNQGLDVARTLSDVFATAKNTIDAGNALYLGRDQVNNILKNVLESNKDLHGTFSAWELNALDGQDGWMNDGLRGNDSDTGRFMPYWNRGQDGSIHVQTMQDVDSQQNHSNGISKSAWYNIPKEQLREAVLGPVSTKTQDKNVWLVTLSTPIIAEDKFYGVSGTNYDLAFVQKLSEQIDAELYAGQGVVSIVNEQGVLIAASADASLIGQPIKTTLGNDWKNIEALIKQGDNKAWLDESSHLVRAVAPINIGKTERHWSILIQINQAIVLQSVNELSQVIEENSDKNISYQLIAAVVIATLALSVLWYLAQRISKPLQRAAKLARSIESGDLSQRMNHKSSDEVGQLSQALDNMASSLQSQVAVAEKISQGDLTQKVIKSSGHDQLGIALERMLENLNELVNQIKYGSKSIEKRANSVSEMSHELASGATESAASVTQINATVHQITDQIRYSAGNAKKASQLSEQSHQSASHGNSLMGSLKQAMQDIEQSGNDVTNIIAVIENIAEQTNLLALNAAIEAARAGEHGRGFAVVADEVRQLAARSAEAAKQTTSLIRASAERSQHGVVVTDDTAEALENIVSSASEVSSLVTQIATAADEQANGFEQISEGVQQINQVTQYTSDISEKCSVDANDLTRQARKLSELVEKFKTL